MISQIEQQLQQMQKESEDIRRRLDDERRKKVRQDAVIRDVEAAVEAADRAKKAVEDKLQAAKGEGEKINTAINTEETKLAEREQAMRGLLEQIKKYQTEHNIKQT